MSPKVKKLIIRVICILLLISMAVGTIASIAVYGLEIKYQDKEGKTITLNDFKDTKGHWAQGTILRWGEYNIISGFEGNFMPNNPVKRGDLAIMLDRLMGLKTISYNYFTDLHSNAYYRDSVLRTVAEGYFTGTGDNKINPEGYATREEVAVILARAFNFDTSKSGYIPVQDNNMISSWARSSIYALYDLGYMRGDGKNMNPKQPVTRAEMITLFDNIAEMYVPQRSSIQTGNSFSNTVKNNVVIARGSIELVRSIVGRDVILTQSVNGFTLNNTQIKGRLVVLGGGTINLNSSDIGRIEIHNKTSINGITPSVKEIYIKNLGTESSLDTIPEVLYLEPGVRVRIAGTMYENTENKVKKYTGLEINADISNTQGYVAGGPKINGNKHLLGIDNNFEFKDVKVVEGKDEIQEVGVVIGLGAFVPSLQDNHGRSIYSGRYDRPIDFQVGRVRNEMTYRFYAIDKSGLIGYGEPVTVQEYDFDMELNIFDINYPEAIRVEMILQGDNIPQISNIRVPYGTTEVYSEELPLLSLSESNDPYADKNKPSEGFKRYVGELSVKGVTIDGETTFEPPTFFGYIITFSNGNIERKFPVLSDAIPEGIAPIEVLNTGNAYFGTNNRLVINNNRITTRHVPIQEAGVIYKVVPEGTPVFNPDTNWTKQATNVNIGLRDSAYYSTTLTNVKQEGETHFASYVKTANGYYYGNVKVVKNNWKGSEEGPQILGTPNITVLSDTQAIVEVPVELRQNIDLNKYNTIVSFEDRAGGKVQKYNGASLKEVDAYLNLGRDKLYFYIETLTTNTVYDVVLQLYDVSGNPSNIISFDIDTRSKSVMSFTNKTETTSKTTYDLNVALELQGIEITSVSTMNESYRTYITTDTNPWKLHLHTEDSESKTIVVNGRYYVARGVGNIKSYNFTRYFEIN